METDLAAAPEGSEWTTDGAGCCQGFCMESVSVRDAIRDAEISRLEIWIHARVGKSYGGQLSPVSDQNSR